MSSKRRRIELWAPQRGRSARGVPRPLRPEYLLEEGTLEGLIENKRRYAAYLKYQWELYAELAGQRNPIRGALCAALLEACRSDFTFERWQRALKYKYSLHPLSAVGSLTWVGGRFNIGRERNPEIASFPALYIASDKDTALQEALGRATDESGARAGMDFRELALMNPQSETIVSVSGLLEKAVDLRDPDSLSGFVDLMRGFKLSPRLGRLAKEIGLPAPEVIRDTAKLVETLLMDDWRKAPVQGDVPSNSQVFGHLVCLAGIEGIIYPSRCTGRECLAVFPQNLWLIIRHPTRR